MASFFKAALSAAGAGGAPRPAKAALPKRERAPPTEGAKKADAAAAATGGKVPETTDKLEMSLDDVIKTGGRGGRKGKSDAAPKKGAEASGGKSAAGKKAGRRGGRRMRLRSQKAEAQAVAAQPQQSKKAKAQARDRNKGSGKGSAKGKEGWSDGRSWSKDWDDRGMAGRETYADWEGGARKRRLVSDTGSFERLRQVESRAGFGWGGGPRSSRGGRDNERAGRIDRLDRMDRPDRRVDDERWSAGGMRSAGGAERGRGRMRSPPRREEPKRALLSGRGASTAASGLKIRVSNVPKSLDERDIREAFEDVGTVSRCSVERGVAVVTFTSASAAKKAVATFDRGELNGQTIYVAFEA